MPSKPRCPSCLRVLTSHYVRMGLNPKEMKHFCPNQTLKTACRYEGFNPKKHCGYWGCRGHRDTHLVWVPVESVVYDDLLDILDTLREREKARLRREQLVQELR